MEPGTLAGPRDEPGYGADGLPPAASQAQVAPSMGLGSLAVALIAVLLWFGLLDHRPLFDPDEGRYAEIAREMLVSGDWTTPRLNGLVYLEKPPLQYWATALAFKLLGRGNETARLWTVITGLAGIFLVFYAGRRLYSTLAGLYAALILASGFLYFGAGHFNSLDMSLTFFTEAAVFALALALHPRASPAEHRFWIHAMWVACALAVLTKGLIGIVLPGAALALYSLVFRDFAVLKRLAPASGAALFLLVAAPWFVAAAKANPDFLRFFFVHEHFERYLTTVHQRYEPFWYFIPLLLVGTLPWTIPVLEGLWHGLRHPDRATGFSSERFLAVWSVFVLVFFSMSQSKLAGYIVPLLPPLALLAGRYLCTIEPASLRRQLLPALAIPLVLLGILCFGAPFTRGGDASRIAAAAPYFVIAITLTSGAALHAFVYAARAPLAAVAVLALATMAAGQALLASVDIVSPHRTAWHIARQIAPQVKDGTRLYSVGFYEQSLPFYLGRTMTLVAFRGELDYGLRLEPHKGIPGAAFSEAWLKETDAIAIMKKETYVELGAAGLPMRLIAEDTTRVAVRRP